VGKKIGVQKGGDRNHGGLGSWGGVTKWGRKDRGGGGFWNKKRKRGSSNKKRKMTPLLGLLEGEKKSSPRNGTRGRKKNWKGFGKTGARPETINQNVGRRASAAAQRSGFNKRWNARPVVLVVQRKRCHETEKLLNPLSLGGGMMVGGGGSITAARKTKNIEGGAINGGGTAGEKWLLVQGKKRREALQGENGGGAAES